MRGRIAHLRELHLVHALAGVPVEEGLAAEHRGELRANDNPAHGKALHQNGGQGEALAGAPLRARHHLLRDALHHLLHARAVAAEADRHLEALGRDVADRAFKVVGDPLLRGAIEREKVSWLDDGGGRG